jgi:hypothetical protein
MAMRGEADYNAVQVRVQNAAPLWILYYILYVSMFSSFTKSASVPFFTGIDASCCGGGLGHQIQSMT